MTAEILKFNFGNASQSVSVKIAGDFQKVFRPSANALAMGDALLAQPLNGKRVLDVGCGSGVLGIAAACCGAQVVAADICCDALDTTRDNAARNGAEIKAIQSNGLDQVEEGDFDIVIANCQLASHVIADPGQPSVSQNVNDDGLQVIAAISRQVGSKLSSGGRFITALSGVGDLDRGEEILLSNWLMFEPLSEYWFAYEQAHSFSGLDAENCQGAHQRIIDGRLYYRSRVYRLRRPLQAA